MLSTEIDLITTPKNYGSHAGLYLSLSLAFLHTTNHYDFQRFFNCERHD